VRGIGEDLGALLADMGDGLAAPLNTPAVERWLERSRAIGGGLRRAQDMISDADMVEAGAGAYRELGPLLYTAGGAVGAFSRLQADPASLADREHAVAAVTTGKERAAAVTERLLGLDTTDPAQAAVARSLSSMLVDGERLLHEVDVREGAHVFAVMPT
jgi:hypothetical protein